jgi:hypothetical protein
MINKEKALEIVGKYIKERNREYISISPLDKIRLEKSKRISYPSCKYYEQERDIYVVNYDIEGYQQPIAHFVCVDAETGEVLFTASPHGYVEEWED